MPPVRRAAKQYDPPALEKAVQQQWAKGKAHARVHAAQRLSLLRAWVL